jgi:hypothetical protein
MRRLTSVLVRAAMAGAALGLPATAAGGPSTTVVRLDGIGPLHLGMTRTAALATGGWRSAAPGARWGARRRSPTASRARRRLGRSGAPRSSTGGRLSTLSFTRGVRTSTGVTVARTTAARMVARYRAAGFTASARYESTFQGTFVRVRRHGRDVVGGFADGSVVTIVAIPAVAVCE